MPHPWRHSRPGWMWLWVCWLGTHSFLGQPVPVRHHPLGEKLPPHIQPKPPLSQFKTIPLLQVVTEELFHYDLSCSSIKDVFEFCSLVVNFIISLNTVHVYIFFLKICLENR